ncbi:MAG: Dabb family protein [Mariprofundales bacterium]|nr:Dabb family protein [Mariprofundales bacterium]
MVKHIVTWKRQPQSDDAAIAEIKRQLEALVGRIDGLLHLEVGIDISLSEASADLVLYSEFTDLAALHAYQTHPDHQAVIPLVQASCCQRQVIDYHT